jgi:L-threonylcarbamoyladenylate synthase
VVFPTDTLYGLGADAFSDPALERIFAIKGRPAEISLPLLVSCWDHLKTVTAQIPVAARQLAQRFWPGPLTLVLPKAQSLPSRVTGGRETVAVRMPNHPVALEIIRRLDRPITGTSANRSGQQDLLDLDSVRAELADDVDYIVQSGPQPNGTPSTIIDMTAEVPQLLRQGALPFEQILREAGLNQPPKS